MKRGKVSAFGADDATAEILGEAEITGLQREKIEAKEVIEGDLCGLNLKTHKKTLLEIGDTLEFFTREVVERHL